MLTTITLEFTMDGHRSLDTFPKEAAEALRAAGVLADGDSVRCRQSMKLDGPLHLRLRDGEAVGQNMTYAEMYGDDKGESR